MFGVGSQYGVGTRVASPQIGGAVLLRGSVAWVRRSSLVAALLVIGVSGAQASSGPMPSCGRADCSRAGTIRWTRLLPGAYVVHDDSRGTVPAVGEPFAAIGDDVAVFGLGTTILAYDAESGIPRWAVEPKQLAAGARIVSVRVWQAVVTVGIAAAGTVSSQPTQTDLILDSATGRLIRSYPSTSFGGTVAADARHAVVVGPGAVTSYNNVTGKMSWRRPTGAAAQTWQLDGDYLYVTVAAGGYLGGQPTTALRRIDLRSGVERIVSPAARVFAGTFSAALDGVVLFSGVSGVTAYSGSTAARLWHVADAVPQAVDLGQQRFYLAEGAEVAGVDPRGVVQAEMPGSPSLYGERNGVALGLDIGAGGQAWGVSTQSQHVVWSTGPLPWPHVFVDLSGLGGSADPRSDAIILAVCGQPNLNTSPPQCTRPELVVINR